MEYGGGKNDQHLNFFSTVSASVMSCFRLHFKLPSTEVNQRGKKQQKIIKLEFPPCHGFSPLQIPAVSFHLSLSVYAKF